MNLKSERLLIIVVGVVCEQCHRTQDSNGIQSIVSLT
jgi:hypothetical protein